MTTAERELSAEELDAILPEARLLTLAWLLGADAYNSVVFERMQDGIECDYETGSLRRFARALIRAGWQARAATVAPEDWIGRVNKE